VGQSRGQSLLEVDWREGLHALFCHPPFLQYDRRFYGECFGYEVEHFPREVERLCLELQGSPMDQCYQPEVEIQKRSGHFPQPQDLRRPKSKENRLDYCFNLGTGNQRALVKILTIASSA
jgi:hypothetical protein